MRTERTLCLQLLLCIAVSPTWTQTDTDVTSVTTVTTGTKKLGSEDLPEDYHAATATNEFEDSFSSTTKTLSDVEVPFPGSRSLEGDIAKPHKSKKKILVSNLKNISDKIVLPNDRFERQNPKNLTGLDLLASPEDGNVRSNTTAETTNKTETVQEKEIPSIESRSFQESDSSINGGPKSFKIISSSTESYNDKLTTSSYIYQTFSEIQKVLNNNFLNVNEGDANKPRIESVHTSQETIVRLPETKAKENSVKTEKFPKEFFGPTGQSDWVPIVPDKFAGPATEPSVFRTTTTPIVFLTTENNKIFIPSTPVRDDIDLSKKIGPASTPESNFIPVQGLDVERSTPFVRANPEKLNRFPNPTSESNNIDDKTPQPTKSYSKYRGNVKYRTPQSTSNSSLLPTESAAKNSTSSVRGPVELELPPTGASWALATLGGPMSLRFTRKPSENSTLLTKSNLTSFIKPTISNETLSVKNVKSENITKEQSQVLKNTIPDTIPSDVTPSVSKYNESQLIGTPSTSNPRPFIEELTTLQAKNAEIVLETTTPGTVQESSSSEVFSRHAETTPPTEFIRFSVSEEVIETTTEQPISRVQSTTSKSVSEDYPDLDRTASYEILKITTEIPRLTSESSPESSSQTGEVPMTNARVINKSEASSTTQVPVTSVPDVLAGKEGSYTTIRNTDSEVPMTTIRATFADEANGREVMTESATEVDVTTFRQTFPIELDLNKTAETTSTSSSSSTSTSTSTSTSESASMSTSTTTTTTTTTTSTTAATSSAIPSTERTTESFISTEETRESSEPKKVPTFVPQEEGIHYQDYIPATDSPYERITEESVSAYLRLTVDVTSWEELCRSKEDLRNAIVKMLTEGTKLNVTAEFILFLNLNDKTCAEKMAENVENPSKRMFLPVNMFIMDKNGDFDKNLSEAFLTLWGMNGLDLALPIRKVDFVTPIVEPSEVPDETLGPSVVAAIVISCVAGVCVILLGILFVVMKRRQKRFNYGQRCTPVSLDAYSLDSVSIHNSVRRKGMRASKRSYGNAAFDDPEVPSHPMNFAGLANFSSDKEQLYEEFNIIPQVSPKTDELPVGAETKNRYANVIPLPETRVHLGVKDGDNLSDYINANYVRGPKGAEKLYIACQAPMDATVEDFWRMIWEQQCKVIIMLTDLQENGVDKCADYLPPSEVTDNLRLFGDFQITLKKRDVKEKYIISTLKLKNMEGNLWREVTHLWYLGWPEQGVPSEANSLIAFLIEARSQMKTHSGSSASAPVVVHCSPGTGRTGTVIACDLCIREFEQTRMVDIPKCVFNLRRDRAGSVQTKDQYAFIYQVLNLYATKLTGGGMESI